MSPSVIRKAWDRNLASRAPDPVLPSAFLPLWCWRLTPPSGNGWVTPTTQGHYPDSAKRAGGVSHMPVFIFHSYCSHFPLISLNRAGNGPMLGLGPV